MSQHHVNAIAGRLSLRPPQRESLQILHDVCQLVRFDKDTDVAQALEAIRNEFAQVKDFERDFPSLCFALATGVGKTRLMGAFIAYLHRAEGIQHFVVLAPNLTIYNKLTADFTPNTPKYVFQGISEFAIDPPEIITGDNYESGRGVRSGRLFGHEAVHINIFNISKINSEVRGGSSPRIKRLSEYVGESYFDYLSKLDDLVLLMDESHRYRASAGVRAINELRPLLGLELTATPQVMRGQNAEPFKNVIYSYPLSAALDDGFVKEPAVATRENFDINNYDEDSLERLKLEDGIHIHEETKVQLEVYAREHSMKRVKPFMLVVAKDTQHASQLRKIIEDDTFFAGQYKGKVAEVHSAQRGEERDENVEKLLSVEDPNDETEIVIHVDQLKEGWDVTNLYTIVPLRAFNSRTLIEQAIGRGLRLPYGKRVGIAAVDRLTIVSHDRFQEIIDEANKGESIIRTGVVIGRDIPTQHSKPVDVPTNLEQRLLGTEEVVPGTTQKQKPLFDTEGEREAARATLDVIKTLQRLQSSKDLQSDEVQAKIAEQVKEAMRPVQPELAGVAEEINVEEVVAEVTQQYIDLSIDIPRIVIVPSDDATFGYRDFDLECSHVRLQPVSQEILIQHLHDHDRYKLQSGPSTATEQRLEDYLVRALIDFDDISYDEHAALLYKLSGQMVAHLRSYLANEDEVLNVLVAHNRQLVDTIYAQMQENYFEQASSSEVKITRGFTTFRPSVFLAPPDTKVRNFREPVDEKRDIRRMLFGGFACCLYSIQKFGSDPERRFAVVLENEKAKWFKPTSEDARQFFQIYYRVGIEEGHYEPDFVAETEAQKYLCEVKAKGEMTDEKVLAKADKAAEWCRHASSIGDKPWSYLLIPDESIDESKTLAGLAAAYTYHGD